MAWFFSFPLQALPVWSLLPVFLSTFRAEEPCSYTLQWQAFQVWLLWSCLCWCHNTQQSHPDTHWWKALQVSTWSQHPLPAEIREWNALLLFTGITAPYQHMQKLPWKPRSDHQIKPLWYDWNQNWIRLYSGCLASSQLFSVL